MHESAVFACMGPTGCRLFEVRNLKTRFDPQGFQLPVSLSVRFFLLMCSLSPFLRSQGAPEVLSAYYGPLLTEPAPGYNVTLRIDLSSPPAGMDVGKRKCEFS